MTAIRPLRRVNAGAWRSRDGRWTFLRHMGDPSPQRWFAYVDQDEWPVNEGEGHVTLRAVADWAGTDYAATLVPKVAPVPN